MIPRWYQSEAIEAPFSYWAKAPGLSSPCIEVPTGGGKSAIIGWTARRLVEDCGCRVIVATHRSELITQDAEDMRAVWPAAPIGIYSAGLNRREAHADVVICGVQSMVRNLDGLGHRDVLIVDEAHLVAASDGTMYRRLVDGLRAMSPDMRLIGYTATPYRLGQGYVTEGDGALFDAIPYRVDVRRLIEEGHLSPIITGVTSTQVDTTNAATRAGEFVARDLELAANIDEVNDPVADDVSAALLGGRRLALVYGVSVAHASMLRNALRMRGIPTEMIDGSMDRGQRQVIVDAFKRGELRAICSCDVLTTGFNVPAVDVVAIVRPTQSPALYVQIVGRGMRTFADKRDCLLLDYGANIARHGPIDAVRVKPKNAKGEGDAPVKTCPRCFAQCATACRVCPHCDSEFPPPERKANARPSNLPALTIKIPEKRTRHEVGQVEVWKHTSKKSGLDMVRVDYFEPTTTDTIGEKIASEWLCFAHEGFAYRKACDWWVDNVGTRLPDAVDDAVARLRSGEMPRVTAIDVVPDGEFARVVAVHQAAPREPGDDDDRDASPPPPPIDTRPVGFEDDELPF